MKVYPPSFPRIKLQKGFTAHNFIYHIGGITAKKSYPGVEYYLRTNPSAGALYPNEVYFQSRGVEGFVDGIYHFEVASSSVTLLHELEEKEGLEPLVGFAERMKGLLFFISSPYYRSAWKYRQRAFRYCLLDTGHILGAIEAGSYIYGHAYRVVYGADLEGLNRFFGFSEEEFFLSTAVVAVPQKGGEVSLPATTLKQSDPAGVFMSVPSIEEAYRETVKPKECKKEPRFPHFTLNKKVWEEAILKRRSIRSFSKRSITKMEFDSLVERVNLPVPSDCDEPLRLYAVVNRVEGLRSGIYRNGELVKEGDFAQKAGYLCLEQSLGSESAATFFILSDGCNYRPLYQKAGIWGHRLYLMAQYLNLGCSGIGAYYDDETREFLGDKGMVLYALAVGR